MTGNFKSSIQWGFQDPKMEVPTIHKAYIRHKFQGISPENMAMYGTNVPPFQDPEDLPLINRMAFWGSKSGDIVVGSMSWMTFS